MARPSLPEPLAERLKRQFGLSIFTQILRAFDTERLPSFRVNTLKSNDNAVMGALRESAIQFERVKDIPHAFRIKNRTSQELLAHPLAKSGAIYLQGLSSMIPPLILDPKPGETILDLCAAPGSKTTQIASLTGNQAHIAALEENVIRFERLENSLKVQRATSVTAIHTDATLWTKHTDLRFDKILADVPCSAEGRINLHDPRSYKFWNEKNIATHAKLQRRLLRGAVQVLKPGGTLVYSTCTLAPEENEEMISWLLSEFPELKSSPIDPQIANARKTANQTITVLPSEQSEGFFIAKIVKPE